MIESLRCINQTLAMENPRRFSTEIVLHLEHALAHTIGADHRLHRQAAARVPATADAETRGVPQPARHA